MNIRDLEYLIAVSKHKSFVKASLECHVSQPTLSGQVRKLENYLGAQIFERTTKQVTVTSFGKEIIKKARVIIDKTHEIKNLSFVDIVSFELILIILVIISFILFRILRNIKSNK